MNQAPDNLLTTKSGSNGSLLLPLFIALVVMICALFIGELLFGKNSLEVYLKLKNDKQVLYTKIYELKNENAHLQKQYFELKGLMPSNEDDE